MEKDEKYAQVSDLELQQFNWRSPALTATDREIFLAIRQMTGNATPTLQVI